MEKASTGYIFMFAAAVCLVCSVFVAGSAVALKERQEENKVLDRQKNVLNVAGLMKPGESIDAAEVAKRFDSNIVAKIVDLETGDYVDADAKTFDMQAEMKDPSKSKTAEPNDAKVMRVPNRGLVYHVVENGRIKGVIVPVQGKGLWSTLMGFVALESDGQTVSGLIFYAHAETPGLGGEVDNPSWRGLWKGRKVYGEDGAPKIAVIKGMAGPASADPYHVDGLSGATLTSRGVTSLLHFWLGEPGYSRYLAKFREEAGAGASPVAAASPSKAAPASDAAEKGGA
jgi:Na+-transporting NADH:ubiquinone oxidoreductase subunit C